MGYGYFSTKIPSLSERLVSSMRCSWCAHVYGYFNGNRNRMEMKNKCCCTEL